MSLPRKHALGLIGGGSPAFPNSQRQEISSSTFQHPQFLNWHSFNPIPVLRPAYNGKPDVTMYIELCALVKELHDAPVGLAVVGVGYPASAPFVSTPYHGVGDGESLYLHVLSPVRAFVAHGIGLFARFAVERVYGGDERVTSQNDVHDGFWFAALVVDGFPPARRRERVGRESREGAKGHDQEQEIKRAQVHVLPCRMKNEFVRR